MLGFHSWDEDYQCSCQRTTKEYIQLGSTKYIFEYPLRNAAYWYKKWCKNKNHEQQDDFFFIDYLRKHGTLTVYQEPIFQKIQ